ncbi:MAG: metal-dependent hydrolase [Verrucomicrobiales bacterium]|nr:metal-dependent hydrolase [Verrucomicrobiales bacterium]
MDPISQGAIGAVAAGCLANPEKERPVRLALLAGWGAGMLADADVFIHSEDDPLLVIEYHRHFTHSLAFIPIGGLICALLWWLVFRRNRKFRTLALFSLAGYATCGLLDACTSYGTQLFWPFSDTRVAWHVISIIDPIFTVTILVLLVIGWAKRSVRLPRAAAIFAIAYLGFGAVQFQRAESLQTALIAERNHSESASMENVKPSIGNLFLWRSVYRVDDRFYADAIRVGLFSKPQIFEGDSVPALDLADLKAGLPADSTLSRDLERFAHFSADYLARYPDQPDVVGDFRYAMIPNSVMPLWGIRIDRSRPDRHVSFENFRENSDNDRNRLFRMLFRGEE